jgi:predicted metal-dependent hydrolase
MSEQLGLLEAVERHELERAAGSLHIRESGRARRLSLQVVPPMRVELVVPRGTKPRAIEAFVRTHAAWIERANREITSRYGGDREPRPQRIVCRSIGREISVEYAYRPRARSRYTRHADLLSVACAQPDFGDAGGILRQWLVTAARAWLMPMFERVSEEVGNRPSRVQFRLQRTRWGSCSASGTISINASALLLDEALVRYLFVHELCHMSHMNHSRSFWKKVERFEPEGVRLDAQLGQAWTDIPFWVVA